MKIRSPLIFKSAGLFTASAVRRWMGTLEYRAQLYTPEVDPADPSCSGQKIFLFWHEYILFPLSLRGHCNLAMLLSRHSDAEILSYVARHLGFACVRGSTNRGGVAALRELLRKSQSMHLAITPDGPRGPRRVLSQGPIFLASRLGIPLVLMGMGYHRPWRFGSWDRFALPRPYSRGRAILSPELFLPPKLDRDGIEHYRQQVERMLNRLTEEAEAWAESGTRREGDIVGHPATAPLACQRIEPTETNEAPHLLRLTAERTKGSEPSRAAV